MKIRMQPEATHLHEIALNYPWHMFTGEEIAVLCNVSENTIWRVKLAPDSPFFLNKCRPEWFLEWMRLHPGFQLTKDHSAQKMSITPRSPESPNCTSPKPRKSKSCRSRSPRRISRSG